MRKLSFALTILFLVACQQKPTKSIEETSNSIFNVKTVLVDTRDSFSYTSFHIPGSVNLVSTDFLVLKDPVKTKDTKYCLIPLMRLDLQKMN